MSKKLDGSWEGCVVGMFIAVDSAYFPADGAKAISNVERTINHKIGSVVWFPTFDDPFPLEACNEARKGNAIPHITWELFHPSKAGNTVATSDSGFYMINDLLAGKYDAYIDSFAIGAKTFNDPVLIRFLHEFNGNWYVWGGFKNGAKNGGPEKVKKVWCYVVDRFRKIGADNVEWLWTPHGPSTDRSEEEWNHVSNYWPGNEYVDWIGLDGYNFFPKDPWGGIRPYRSFDDCFRQLYDDCAKLGPQPMMIAEFGCGEFEHETYSKPGWMKDAFTKMKTEYPRVKIFTWFNILKEHDWRVNSSDSTLNTFKSLMKDPYFIGIPN